MLFYLPRYALICHVDFIWFIQILGSPRGHQRRAGSESISCKPWDSLKHPKRNLMNMRLSLGGFHSKHTWTLPGCTQMLPTEINKSNIMLNGLQVTEKTSSMSAGMFHISLCCSFLLLKGDQFSLIQINNSYAPMDREFYISCFFSHCPFSNARNKELKIR